MSDHFLHAYFLNNSHKRLDKWLHYFDIYERHLSRFRDTSPVMIEIGVAGGGSLAMWREYFGEGAKIVGVDITPTCAEHADPSRGIHVEIGSQDDPSLISAIVEKYGKPDIVLDDGSHVMSHMVATFKLLYEQASPTGVYMVEDAHTCYQPKYEGGLNAPASFMEFTKRKLDELHAHYTNGALPISQFTKSTRSVSIYDSIFVFERHPQAARQALKTAAMGGRG